MRYSPIEQDLLKKLIVTDVGDDCVEIFREAVKQSYHLKEVDDKLLMVYVTNLYAKLHEDGKISTRNKHGIVDILNDIVKFKLNSNELLLSYVIGQMRGVQVS